MVNKASLRSSAERVTSQRGEKALYDLIARHRSKTMVLLEICFDDQVPPVVRNKVYTTMHAWHTLKANQHISLNEDGAPNYPLNLINTIPPQTVLPLLFQSIGHVRELFQ